MKLFSIFVFFTLTFLTHAGVHEKLDKKTWAYYGEEFYRLLASKKNIDKSFIDSILNNYHSNQEGKFDKISPKCDGDCYRHSSVSYDQARKIMFGELDKLTDQRGSYVVDVYCGKKFYFDNLAQVSSMHNEVNIEHTWPQSKFSYAYSKDMQKSDMHHLYLADTQANSLRGNSPFGLIKDFNAYDAESGCDGNFMRFAPDEAVYTPPENHRGNVARSLFYFSTHYELNISEREETVLRKWHKEDPIDDAEIKRHEAIAKYQKVRNPFIDHPELVERTADF